MTDGETKPTVPENEGAKPGETKNGDADETNVGTHDKLYGESDADEKSLADPAEQEDIREQFDWLNDEMGTFHRNTWESSQQFVARGFPMLLLAHQSEAACVKLREDYESKLAGDISFMKGENAASTVGKIFAHDCRRQASANKKVFEACLDAYNEAGLKLATDRESGVWCYDFMKSQGGLEALRRPKPIKPKKLNKSKLSKAQENALRSKGDERAKALPTAGRVTLPTLKVPDVKGAIVVLLGVTDFGNVVQIKHVLETPDLDSIAKIELGRMSDNDYAAASKAQDVEVGPVDQAMEIDAVDKAAESNEEDAA